MRLAQAEEAAKPDDAEQVEEGDPSAEADADAERDAVARVSDDCVSEVEAERLAEEAAAEGAGAAGQAEAQAEERVSGEEQETERGADAAAAVEAAIQACENEREEEAQRAAEEEAAAEEAVAAQAEAEAEADAKTRVSDEEVGTAAEEKAAAREGGTADGSAEVEGEAKTRVSDEEVGTAAEEKAEAEGEAETRVSEEDAARAAEEETKPEGQAVEASETTEEAELPAAAAAESDESAEPVEVTSERVTDETTRTSDEEVQEATAERRDDGAGGDDIGDILKILGVAGAGLAAGALLSGGGEVVETTGDRVIIQRDGEYFVRTDENQLLRRPGSELRTETFSDGSTRTVAQREDGARVITIRDANGYTVRRSKVMPDGREIVLFDDTRQARRDTQIDWTTLPQVDYSVPHREYVDYGGADRQALRDTLQARPVAGLDRRFTLRQVRENLKVRQLMPRLDLDTITFDLGSAAIRPEQARELDALGREMEAILDENPHEVFLIEGHTDAVGGRVMNLALSDRRAETVALALTEYYYIPPENLITQGYGEEHLKIETQGPERANRRATVRRITPLLEQLAAR
ncbi:MAG TPA: OmpA family protein [Thermohalobaculum sp.]|nr:OmpA family protein [Thermohalobaculum sp.]